MAHGQWAVVVRSLDSGELLYELNPHKLMMPASNMKIVTLAAAARMLGWDYRFTTTLETRAAIRDGVLLGDLVVLGTGDPTINARNGRGAATFDRWAAELKAAGIERIQGRIVGNDDAFDDEGLGGGWAWDYLQFGYAAPVGALQYNENVAELTIAPGAGAGAPAIVQIAPGSGLMVINRVVTTAPGTPERVEFRRHLDRPALEVTGSVPLRSIETPPPAGQTSPARAPAPPHPGSLAPQFPGSPAPQLPSSPAPQFPSSPAPPLTRQVAVVNPTLFFAQSLKDALIARGIAIDGSAVDGDDDEQDGVRSTGPEPRVLVRAESPSLREIATVLMKVSQNQYAETLLKALGAEEGKAATVQAGRAAVLRILQDWQIDDQSVVLADGSGLSRYNYLTAGAIVRILERMYADRTNRDPFLASLPIAGRDGTIASRMRRTRAEGNALAKTGSISNVRSLSGYIRSRDGEVLAFSIIANDFVIPAATVTWIADLGVEVLSNFTRKIPDR